MTWPRTDSDWLMDDVSATPAPAAPDFEMRSDPARSTRLILLELVVCSSVPGALRRPACPPSPGARCVSRMEMIAWLRELREFCFVCETLRNRFPALRCRVIAFFVGQCTVVKSSTYGPVDGCSRTFNTSPVPLSRHVTLSM
eukprot:gene5801-biopygen5739